MWAVNGPRLMVAWAAFGLHSKDSIMSIKVTDHGYTAEAMAIAETLSRDEKKRNDIIIWINHMSDPVVYSGEQFDREQHLALKLTNMLREYKCKELTKKE